MPLPRIIARFNRRFTNPIARTIAGRLPGFAIVVHRGRTSGRTFRTPVNVFRRPGGYVIALTYGQRAEWVRNVLAAGGCTLETGGRRYQMIHPRVVGDEARRWVPVPVRMILRILSVDTFLDLSASSPSPSGDIDSTS